MKGVLFKIPISDPKSFSEIHLDTKLYGGDGLLMLSNHNLAVVTNIASGKSTESVFLLKSSDNWQSSNIIQKKYLGQVYPTTVVSKNNEFFVLHSNLNTLVSSSKEASKAELLEESTNNSDVLKKRATIQQVVFSELKQQNQSKKNIENEKVTKVINRYFQGWKTGNLKTLDSVFHSSCHIKFFKDNTFTSWDKDTYFKTMIVEGRIRKNVETKIITIDITDNTANVKVLLTTPDFFITDYINLIKIKESWIMVDKIVTKKER